MRQFTDEQGRTWLATALEEDTPRHHGRWYLVFEPVGDNAERLPVPEVRWQTQASADRTLKTMSEFELRRRVNSALKRFAGA